MKALPSVLVPTIVLSLAAWVFFYVLAPGTPLTPAETLVVVGLCAGVVLLAKWIWSFLRRPRQNNEQGS
jgi:hypothetical protein